ELLRIDSPYNGVDSLSLFLRKMRFRGKRIDSHDLRIDSDYHRGQFGHRMDRFWTGRIDSCDGLLLKKFSKCFESIRSVVESIHTCTEALDLMKGCSESIR
ncbi:hypothetical protein PIB30_103581, partial [Stylosanthes scabra]|nr:hypothetical protein [Stylosanthes scabra]